jgi:hypothetical protein
MIHTRTNKNDPENGHKSGADPAQIRRIFGVEARDLAQIRRRGGSPSLRQDLRGGGVDLQVEDEKAERRDLEEAGGRRISRRPDDGAQGGRLMELAAAS